MTRIDVNGATFSTTWSGAQRTMLIAAFAASLLFVAPLCWGASSNLDRYYPQAAVDSCSNGWVLAEFDVNADGAVTQIEVLDSHPKGMFDEAAKRLLRLYMFYPSQQETGRRQQRVEFEAHGCSQG